MKKIIVSMLAAAMILTAFAGCGEKPAPQNETPQATESPAKETTSKEESLGEITVVTREDGSGTRGAFIELFGIEEKDANGEKIDHTTDEASVTNSTSVMMTTIAGDQVAIGYISLGSLNETVKAVKIDGAEATVENIKNGTYKISRPFNIAIKEGASEAAQNFIKFILSSEGQAVVEENGFIPSEGEAFDGAQPAGKVVVAGSSSVTPVMEKLKEAYLLVNPNAEIEIQQSDSTTGMNSVIDGICDIGMASRELKDSELEKGLLPTVIATDGIAVIVNNENPIDNMTSEQVKSIFVGETTDWSFAE